MAHCMVLLFPFGQNKVTYLYCLYIVFKVHRRVKNLLLISRKIRVFAPLFSKIFEENFQMKNPSLISRKNVPFNNQFWKFCAIYFDFFKIHYYFYWLPLSYLIFVFGYVVSIQMKGTKKSFIYQVTRKAFYDQFFKTFLSSWHLHKFSIPKA